MHKSVSAMEDINILFIGMFKWYLYIYIHLYIMTIELFCSVYLNTTIVLMLMQNLILYEH